MAVTMIKNKSFSICVLLLIGLLGLIGCSKPKTSHDYLTQARQDRQKGDDQAVLIDLKNALQKDPKNGEARYLLAVILNERGEGAAAEIELHKAIDLGLNKSYASAAMGQALLLQRQYQKVIETIKVADDDNGEVAADIYNVRGDAYLALAKVDEAKSAFEKALKEYPDSADAFLGMARLAAIQNDLDGSLHQTDIALSKDPKSTKAWLMKANLMRAQSKDDEARTAYSHIFQLDKSNVPAHLGLASIDMAQEKLDAAKAEIDAALKISPKGLGVNYALGLVEYQRGKFKEAQEAVQQVLKAAPDYMPGILLRGAVAFNQGSYEQALNDFNPGNAYARRLLAATQLNLGETGPAMETLQPLLKPGLGDAQALALAGEAQLKAKSFTKATEYLQKALEINPQAQQIQTQLGLSYLGVGDTERGMSELEEAAKQAPGGSPADMILIVTRLHRKEYDQALTAISNLEKKLGLNPLTLNLRGFALMGEQDFANARKAFEQALAIQPTYLPAIVNLAKLDWHDNNPDAARKRLEAVLKKDKNNAQIMIALAETAAAQKQDHEYVRWMEKAAQAEPNAILPRAKLVDFYLAKNDKASALNVANEAVKAYPGSAAALSLLGGTQLAVGDKEGAQNTAAKLIEKVPNAPSAYLQLGVAQSAAHKLTEARASLNKALKLKPDFKQAQELLIRLDLEENKGDDALKIARQMQAQQPKSPVGYEQEADLLMARKQYSQAVKPLEQALSKGVGSEGLIKLHRALTMAGNEKTAEQRLTSWMILNPKDIAVRTYAASYYMIHNQDSKAISQYQELIKLNPQNVLALNNLASLYQREKDGRALATAEQALALAPENPGIQDTLGWILVEQGQLSRALELLNEAVSKASSVAIIRYHLAVALARAGQKVNARKELEAAISAGLAFPELADAKAMLKDR